MPCSIRGSAMAVLDIEVDTAAVSPVRKQRRVGALFIAAVGWIVLIALAAALAGALPIASPTDMDILARRAPPGAGHWLGTDQLGRDEFSRLIYGARISLTVVLLAFPPLVFVLAVTAYMGQSALNITLVIGVLSIPAFTRVARAVTLSLSEREFVVAARALGATHARI